VGAAGRPVGTAVHGCPHGSGGRPHNRCTPPRTGPALLTPTQAPLHIHMRKLPLLLPTTQSHAPPSRLRRSWRSIHRHNLAVASPSLRVARHQPILMLNNGMLSSDV
jgi:hypothetical protein